MLTCYRCGQTIPEGLQRKRNVVVGTSSGGDSGWYPGGWYFGSGRTTHRADVWMCPRCAEAHDKEETQAMCCVGCVIAVALAAAFVLVMWFEHWR